MNAVNERAKGDAGSANANSASPQEMLVNVILDRSGSMESCRDSMISGYNEYLNSLRGDKNSNYCITLIQFDATEVGPQFTVDYTDKPLIEVPPLDRNTFVPRGRTPLYDAIGHCIQRVDAKGRGVITVIITDGEENASKRFTNKSIRALIEQKKSEGWEFVFLGTDIDSNAVGGSLGVAPGSISNYARGNEQALFRNLAASTIMRSSQIATMGAKAASQLSLFDDKQRLEMGENRMEAHTKKSVAKAPAAKTVKKGAQDRNSAGAEGLRASRSAGETAVEAGVAAPKPESPTSTKAGDSSIKSAAAREELLRSPVVSMEDAGYGVNNVKKVMLENGEVALFKPAIGEPPKRMRENITSDMTNIQKARQLFQDAGLCFPTIPEELAVRLRDLSDKRLPARENIGDLFGTSWLFSTREIKMSPYNVQYYLEEVERTHVEDYVILAHSGYGVNSYAIQYYLVQGPLRMFLHLAWGGVYQDANANAAEIRDCFSIADQIVRAVPRRTFPTGEYLTIVGTDVYGSYWSRPGETRRGRDALNQNFDKPPRVLAEALDWLASKPLSPRSE